MKGRIAVNTENIFPIIKRSLYSNQEIFLRELVSNAVDATQKLKTLSGIGEFSGELGDLTVSVELNEVEKTIKIHDRGIGMTAEEIEKYINQVAFSGATEFMEQYKDKMTDGAMIGAFGLGFYSAFMVAKDVRIDTLSYKEGSVAASWTCDGSTEFEIGSSDKAERGTTITLFVADDATEYLSSARLEEILQKYCKFLPIPIAFGTETIKEGEGDDAVEKEVPRIINNLTPIWAKKPADLSDEDYYNFYEALFPYHEKPLFWIHLNVDFPFNLTGVLYFPKIKADYDPNKNKIKLFCNQVFITDSVEEIVPDFMRLLHGVIDSPDIPLNVSRSFLQTDGNVKKITSHITKKISDKLSEIFKKDRAAFEEKFADLDLFIKYGMLSEEKFFEKAKDFCLLKNVDGKYFTIEEYKQHIAANQTDKNENLVVVYTNDPAQQATNVDLAKKRGIDLLELGTPIDAHFIGLLEQKLEKVTFKRVDSSPVDKLVEKEHEAIALLDEAQTETVKKLMEEAVGDEKSGLFVRTEALSIDDLPVLITRNEFMRRMRDMDALSGRNSSMPDFSDVVVNTAHPLCQKMAAMESEAEQKQLAGHLLDLARLSQGMLKGENLSKFIQRSLEVVK